MDAPIAKAPRIEKLPIYRLMRLSAEKFVAKDQRVGKSEYRVRAGGMLTADRKDMT